MQTPEAQNFTPRAQKVLALARGEADRLHHNWVGTEHLLLGLIRLGQGTAVNVLRRSGVDLESLRVEIEKEVGTGPDQKMIGNIPYTPRIKNVLALAMKEARALHHTYVGTEHILLGLLREGDGVANNVLESLGVDLDKTRTEILRELDPNFRPDAGTATISTLAHDPASAKPQRTSVDVGRRYDVYCAEGAQSIVVYRNALFKSRKSLLSTGERDAFEFLELELADGQTVFVSRFSVIKFCEPGATPGGEKVSGK